MIGGQNDDDQIPDRLKEVEVKLSTVIERSVEDRNLLIKSIDINNHNSGKMDILLSTVKSFGEAADRREATLDKRLDRFEMSTNEKIETQNKRMDSMEAASAKAIDQIHEESGATNKRLQVVEEKWNIVRGIGVVFGLLWVVIAGYIVFVIQSLIHH